MASHPLPQPTFGHRRLALYPLNIRDFSGGWNPRDAPGELALNESPDMINVTMDERGGIVKRNGLTRVGTQSISAAGSNIFYSPSLDLFFLQDGTGLKKTNDFVTYTLVKTFSTSARCAMADFVNKLVVVHPVDGVFNYDGATFSGAAAGGVKGTCVAIWQNKVWVGGDTSFIARVWWSNPADPTTWTTATDYIDVRERDGQLVTALGTGQTMDVLGRAGLLVFKRDSMHRINSATTGAYTTMSATAGAANGLAVATMSGVTVSLAENGLWATDGAHQPVRISDKLEPLFQGEIDRSTYDNWRAGFYRDRLVFSVTRTGSAVNNLTLEYHPLQKWIVPHGFGANGFAQYTKSTNKLYGLATGSGKTYEIFKGGSDDGTAITSRYQTRWFEPNPGHKMRFRRMVIHGRGSFSVYNKFDFAIGDGLLNQVAITGSGFVWGTGVWGVDPWGPGTFEDFQEFFSLGHGRAISFLFRESSSTSATSPKLLTDGTAIEVGSWACHGIDIDMGFLGYA